jgi:serine/threonine protein kinase
MMEAGKAEYKIMQTLDHRAIVKAIDFFDDKSASRMYLVM